MRPKDFFQGLDDSAIESAIGEAEKRTSAEIRVYVTEEAVDDPVLSAQQEFLRLGMERTEARNGVLICLAPRSQSFAVIGDTGIHQKCGAAFWEEVTNEMAPLLKSGRYTDAVLAGVHKIAAVLAREFPWHGGDRNELPNTVARDEPKHQQ